MYKGGLSCPGKAGDQEQARGPDDEDNSFNKKGHIYIQGIPVFVCGAVFFLRSLLGLGYLCRSKKPTTSLMLSQLNKEKAVLDVSARAQTY